MVKAPNGLRPLLRDFLLEEPQVRLMREPVIAFGQCGWVSASLARFAREHFMTAHLVLLEEPDDWIPAQIPVDDVGHFFTCHSHVVVCVNGWYVDYTVRQFSPKAPFPLVTPDLTVIAEHWGKVTEPATLKQCDEAAA